jgi:hypothetical protein
VPPKISGVPLANVCRGVSILSGTDLLIEEIFLTLGDGLGSVLNCTLASQAAISQLCKLIAESLLLIELANP